MSRNKERLNHNRQYPILRAILHVSVLHILRCLITDISQVVPVHKSIVKRAHKNAVSVFREIHWNPEFLNLQRKRNLVRKIEKFEKVGVKLQCSTERVREIGIPLIRRIKLEKKKLSAALCIGN